MNIRPVDLVLERNNVAVYSCLKLVIKYLIVTIFNRKFFVRMNCSNDATWIKEISVNIDTKSIKS